MTLRQRQPRIEDPRFLDFVREQPCCVCGGQAEAAHVRMASEAHGKRSTGMAEKPDDRWSVPLCPTCHRDDVRSQHAVGEVEFWSRVGLDPFEIAEGLYQEFQRSRR